MSVSSVARRLSAVRPGFRSLDIVHGDNPPLPLNALSGARTLRVWSQREAASAQANTLLETGSLDVEAESLDLVTTRNILPYLAHMDAFLAHVHAALAPGGFAVFSPALSWPYADTTDAFADRKAGVRDRELRRKLGLDLVERLKSLGFVVSLPRPGFLLYEGRRRAFFTALKPADPVSKDPS